MPIAPVGTFVAIKRAEDKREPTRFPIQHTHHNLQASPHVAVFLNAAADIRKLFPVNKSAPAMITKLSAAANAALCAGFAQIAAVSEVDK